MPNKQIIAIVALIFIVLIILTGLFLFLALPMTPSYALATDEYRTEEGYYPVNPEIGVYFSDLEVNESILRTKTPESLIIQIYQGDHIAGEETLLLDKVNQTRKEKNKYEFQVVLDNFEFDFKGALVQLKVKVIDSKSNKEYFSKDLDVVIDTNTPNTPKVEALPGGAEFKSNNIYVYSKENTEQVLNLDFRERAELTIDSIDYTLTSIDHSLILPKFQEGESKYESKYIVEDFAGNLFSGNIIRLLDKEPPRIQLVTSSTVDLGSASSKTANLEFQSNESLKSIKYGANEVTVPEANGHYILKGFKIVPGVNSFEIKATDLAGNETTATIKVAGNRSSTSNSTSRKSSSSSPKCSMEATIACLNLIGGNVCNDPMAYIQCKKLRCSGVTSVTCGGKTYTG